MESRPFIFRPETPAVSDSLRTLIGGKGANLVRLQTAGGDVPPWFAVTARPFEEVIGRAAENGTSFEEAHQRVETSHFPQGLLDAIASEAERLASAEGTLTPTTFAVRSSAAVEDSSEHSFAGQFTSVLNVTAEDIPEAVRAVWLSACSDQVAAYLRMRGLPPEVPSIAVIIQQMIPADVSGVAFGCDPVTGDRSSVVISSLWGLGEGLVSGDLDADTFRVAVNEERGGDESAKITSTVATKDLRYVRNPLSSTGGAAEEVPEEMRDEPSLSTRSIRKIARLVIHLGDELGAPQDLEWSILGEQLYALQTRDVTTTSSTVRQVDAETTTRYVWDNSNIIESYSGVTTPLTFSFIDTVYTEVYQEFTRILGVAEETIRANERVFSMLGLIRGRVYYNLLNWYRLLALLPGYRVNAKFMEGMMGVSEPLEAEPEIVPPRGWQLPRLLLSVQKLFSNYRRLDREVTDFQAHLDQVLGPYENRSLDDRTPEELVAIYRELESELLQRWRIPILNDFYTMIFHGLLRKLVPKEEGDDEGRLLNDLLVGEGGIISTEPMRMLREIAATINRESGLCAMFESNAEEGFQVAREHGTVGPMIDAYLRRFGSRTAGELRLETITYAEEPERLAETLRAWVMRSEEHAVENERRLESVRENAERDVLAALKSSRLKRTLFRRVLRAARTRIRSRENLRFDRTRVFAVVRTLFLGLGRHLAEREVIGKRRDIFYLTIDEIFAIVDGGPEQTALFGDRSPSERIADRMATFEGYRETSSPPDRFESLGHPDDPGFTILEEEESIAGEIAADPNALRGLACSPGVVRGPVRIVRDPNNPGHLAGHIMVAERTDPGWGPLFPLAIGLLVERGSLLSHSAIVAREMGIPAIVAIPQVTTRLVDGEIVEFDGQTGVVRRVGERSGEERE